MAIVRWAPLENLDAAFDQFNTIVAASGALEAEARQRAVYRIRLKIVRGLGEAGRLTTAEAANDCFINDSVEKLPVQSDLLSVQLVR